MAKDDRFEKVYSQGTMNVMEIWMDKETGVNYVFQSHLAFAGRLYYNGIEKQSFASQHKPAKFLGIGE